MTRDPAADVLTAARARLLTAGPAPGHAWCRAWTAEVDAALAGLAAEVVADHRLAVVALGSYGRHELAPSSDVDVLLLHDGLPEPVLASAVRTIVYPLWDAGLTVGHVVRDRREALDATDDLTSATAMLDQRTVAGDDDLAQLLRFQLRRLLRRRPEVFLRGLRAADLRRRARAGDAAEQLEPDLKNGAGGLRDLQSLRWASAAVAGTVGLDPLVAAGYLAASDRPRLARAEQRLLAARVALHLVAGKGEVLRLELHDAVAQRLGREGGARCAHRLLTELFLAARTIDHIHRHAWSLLEADLARGRRRRSRPTEKVVDGFELVDGVLRLPDVLDLDTESLPHRLLGALVDTGAVLDRRSAARLRRRAETAPQPWRWTDDGRRRALSAMWRGRPVLTALAELDDVGILTTLLPEWEPLRGRVQRNPYHRYALDRHAWHAVAELGELTRREQWAAAALAEVGDPDGLLLGTLLHDVGKAIGEPHSETGVPLATRLAERTGAGPATVELVGRLTRLHLVLPDAARRRDITDPAVAHELAALVGDGGTLACLHLLAVADGRATGPTAWSDWTADLVAGLAARVRAVLDRRPVDDTGEGAAATTRRAQHLAPELGADPADVRRHLARLPDRYPATVSPRAVVGHALLAASAPGSVAVRTHVTPAARACPDRASPDRLDVVAPDRPGWLAKIVGVVTLQGGRIVAADAFRRSDGLAITTLRVDPPPGAEEGWWARVEQRLATAAASGLDVGARLHRTMTRADRRSAGAPRVATSVRARPDAAGRSALVEVHTLDRPGVLHAVVTALAELGLDIMLARVQTLGLEVLDAFTVRGADGGPLDVGRLAELEAAVTAALGGPDARPAPSRGHDST